MTYIIVAIIGFVAFYLFSRNKEEKTTLEQEPFGKKFKILVDSLGNNLWGGQQFILMKKSDRQYFIQKSKLPDNESHIYIVYRPNTLHLDFYEKVAGITVKYSKTYNISISTSEKQAEIAKDFATNVRLLGKMEY
jgi:hypothetical protein